ncbi:Piwi domain-containing protein [Halopiger djelfimassiliensis]|uniref:Piwi domain-containing protein n=1 Tax=Halopiger djelfimassiliensis TaxID=1293047 RepID=UPI0006781581|nr:Piwi domain-containing protein [Halopiger djelfimassiliensis]
MKPVNLDENSLNDVPVGDTYAVRFTLDAVFENEGQYPRRNLKFTDGGGDDRTITIWKNSAPEEIYEADYERGATYLITAVEYDIDEGNDGERYQNLTVQSDATLLEMSGPPSTEEALEDGLAETPDTSADSGDHGLTTFRTTDDLPDYDVYEYELVPKQGFRPSGENALRATYRARRKVRQQLDVTPVVVGDAFKLVSLVKLAHERVELPRFKINEVDERPIVYADEDDRDVLGEMLGEILKDAKRDQYDIHGIDKILEPEPVIEKEGFRLHERYNLTVEVLPSRAAYLHVDYRHRILSDRTLDQLDEDEIHPGLRVTPSYRDMGLYVIGVGPETVTDKLHIEGNKSLVQYHREEPWVDPAKVQEIKDADREVIWTVRQRGDGTEMAFPPELLALQGHPENLAQFASDFAEQQRLNTRLSAEQCITKAKRFVERLGPLQFDGHTVEFETNPLLGDRNIAIDGLFHPEANVLQFSGGQTGTHPSDVTQLGVYEAPDPFRVCHIRMEKRDKRIQRGWSTLETKLEQIGAPPDSVEEVTFDATMSPDQLGMEIAAEIPDDHDYDAAFCTLPPKDTGYFDTADPERVYDELKKVLATKDLNSQFAYEATLDERFTIINIALGLVAAAGGIPFTIERALPGDSELHLGIDVTHQYDESANGNHIHLAAATTAIHADGAVLGYTSSRPQSGEKIPPKELKEIIKQAVMGFRTRYDRYPNHITIHRDGFANEDLSEVEKFLTDLDVEYDVVEIRKQAPARVLKYSGAHFDTPQKATAAIYEDIPKAIVATFGEPETLASRESTGLPQPITVERVHGETPIETLAAQTYLLSQAHIGASNATARLPITTMYADLASAAAARQHLPPTNKLRDKIGFI